MQRPNLAHEMLNARTEPSPRALPHRWGFVALLGVSLGLLMVLSGGVASFSSAIVPGVHATAPLPRLPTEYGGVSSSGTLVGAPNAHFMPIRPAQGPRPDATTGCNPNYTSPCSLASAGGPVMLNPQVVLIWWEPSGYNYDNNDTMSVNPSDVQYESTIRGFFLNTTGSGWVGIANQYGGAGGTVKVAGAMVDTSAFPCGTCSSVSNPLSDANVQTEVAKDAALFGLSGVNVEYFVFTPLKIAQCFTSPGTAGNCDASSEVNYNYLGYCAYHSDFSSGGKTYIYAVMPDGGDHLRYCAGWYDTVTPYGPSGDQYADWELSIVSHEFMESITDPEPSSGWTDSGNGGAEIGDLCAWVFPVIALPQDLINNLQGPRGDYLQPEWSNSANACYLPNLPALPTLGALSVHAPSSVTAGGTAYIWVNDTVSTNPAGWGNITVDFPGNPATSTISVVSSTFPTAPTVLPTGTKLAGCYSTCTVTSTYPVVLGSTLSWAVGKTYGMELAFTPTSTGSQSVYVKATVAAPGAAFATEWVPLSNAVTDQQKENVTSLSIAFGSGGSGPSVSVPTASPASVDVGQTVTFSATVTGGTAPYAYSWTTLPVSGLGCGSSSTATLTCTPTAAGSYTANLLVTDANAKTANATSAPLPVYPTPTVAVPTASASTVNVGQTVTFSTTLGRAGSGSDVYAWTSSASGLGCTSANALSITCTPTAAGSYTATAAVTDSNGGTGSNTSASVTVSATTPVVTVPTASPSSVDVGQTVTFSTTATGGTSPYTFRWSTTPATGLGCAASTTSSVACTPTSAGSYTVTVSATDQKGATSTPVTSPSYTVSADPTVSAPAPSKSTDVGQTVSFSTTLTGAGSGGDVYAWSTSPASGLGCSGGTSSTVSCTPTSAGAYTVSVKVTDSNGGTGSASSTPYTVYAAPVVNTPTASPATGYIGQTVSFSATVASPGSGGDTYAWTSSSASLGCSTSTTLSVTCVPTAAGTTYTVTVTATDTNGGLGSSTSADFTVSSSPPLLANAAATPNPATAGSTVRFTSTVSGGLQPITFTWVFGDGTTSTAANTTHVYQNAGTYSVSLFVNDSSGASKHVQIALAVQAGSSSGGSGQSGSMVGPLPLWALLLVVVLVAAIVVGVALTRRRHHPMEAASAYPVGDPYAPAPMAAAPPPPPPGQPTGAPSGAPAPAPSGFAPPPPPPSAGTQSPPNRPMDEVAPDPFGTRGRR